MNPDGPTPGKKLVLIGNPNVGKSVIFRLLTGNYVLVSNFPGTTVEVSRGKMSLGGTTYEVIDTPGVNSLIPQSEDERVTCEILLREKPDVLIQVADAKNLRRTLLITSQLLEFGSPVILVLNMMDEAEERGIEIDTRGLSSFLSVPIVETIAIFSKGKKQLLAAIQAAGPPQKEPKERFPEQVETAVRELECSPKLLAVEWLALNDPTMDQSFGETFGTKALSKLRTTVDDYRSTHHRPLSREIAEHRSDLLDRLVALFKKKRQSRLIEGAADNRSKLWLALLAAGLVLFAWNEIGAVLKWPTPFSVVISVLAGGLDSFLSSHVGTGQAVLRDLLLGNTSKGYRYGIVPELIHFLFFIAPVIVPFAVLLNRNRKFCYEFGVLTRKASTGIPILIGVLLLIYEFVGYTGAQTLVGLLEDVLFGRYLIPAAQKIVPSGIVFEFLVGKYGMISMGLTYAIAIVLPVVGTFFIAFGLLEDSGYLPRLSILSDRVMRAIGLNGKATLPMVLGLGCCTMATMSTRILNSKKERLIATLLLALGIPCSAQLGVMLGIAAGFSPTAALVVIGVVLSQLFLVGYLASMLFKGKKSEFIFEIPPIRVPQLRNVGLKTWYRVQWYLKEAVPLFLIGTGLLFLLDRLTIGGRSLLVWIQTGFEPVLSRVLHLPAEAASMFVLGFLRRDYGAAGLFDLTRKGAINGQQAVVSLIVITLFVPCFASFLMIAKEQGMKKAAAITAFIVPFAISVGGVVSWVLRTFDVQFH